MCFYQRGNTSGESVNLVEVCRLIREIEFLLKVVDSCLRFLFAKSGKVNEVFRDYFVETVQKECMRVKVVVMVGGDDEA